MKYMRYITDLLACARTHTRFPDTAYSLLILSVTTHIFYPSFLPPHLPLGLWPLPLLLSQSVGLSLLVPFFLQWNSLHQIAFMDPQVKYNPWV